MATYAIGDVQGCFDELQTLLETIGFDRGEDRLWFVGDLVNRGPKSLETLRFVRDLGERSVCVLGNHDLHLLAIALGSVKGREDDTLQEVLAAPDCGELLDWLRSLPLVHLNAGHLLVHAGLPPQWNADEARALAGEVETELRGPRHREFLAHLYGSWPDRWSESLRGIERLRVIVNATTRMRFCKADGTMEFRTKGDATMPPAGYFPWFEAPGRKTVGVTVICGHWSALGLRVTPNLLALDSGCVWGGKLTAVRLEDRRLYEIPCFANAGLARAHPKPQQ